MPQLAGGKQRRGVLKAVVLSLCLWKHPTWLWLESGLNEPLGGSFYIINVCEETSFDISILPAIVLIQIMSFCSSLIQQEKPILLITWKVCLF